MKTADQALTEWVDDEIIFDYCDGRGPLLHNRDQFIKVCKEFTIYDPGQVDTEGVGCGSIGRFTIGSGAVLSGAIGSGRIGSVMLSTGSIMRMGPGGVPVVGTATLVPECDRDDITKIANWSVLNRIKQAAFLCADFFSPIMCQVERPILTRIQTILEPRNVAQYSSAKELILKLMGLSIEHENSRNSSN